MVRYHRALQFTIYMTEIELHNTILRILYDKFQLIINTAIPISKLAQEIMTVNINRVSEACSYLKAEGFITATIFTNYDGVIHSITTKGRLFVEQNILGQKSTQKLNDMNRKGVKQPKVFISHRTADSNYAQAIIDMMEKLGVKHEDIFCSSVPGYGIPFGKKILEALHNEFDQYDLLVIIIHSPRYYESHICLNEMGATWILRSDHFSFLTSDCSLEQLDGVIDKQEIAFRTNDKGTYHLLHDFKVKIQDFFNLKDIHGAIWESAKNKFISEVETIKYEKTAKEIPVEAEYSLPKSVANTEERYRKPVPLPPNMNPAIQNLQEEKLRALIINYLKKFGASNVSTISSQIKYAYARTNSLLQLMEAEGILISEGMPKYAKYRLA